MLLILHFPGQPSLSPYTQTRPTLFPTNTMSTPTVPPSSELDTTELKSLIARDLAASNEVAARITQLRLDIEDGKPLPSKKVNLMEQSNKDMTKDLVLRVEKIESAANIEAADRELLQALNARLAVCDLQAMRLAELRDLEFFATGTKAKAFLDAEAGSSVKTTMEPEEQLSAGRASTRETKEDDEGFVLFSQERDAASLCDGSEFGDERV